MDKGLLIRLITSIIIWANMTLAAAGIQVIPIGEETVYIIVSLIVTFISFLWCGWKNNNFTGAAKEAQEFLKEIKLQDKFDNIIHAEEVAFDTDDIDIETADEVNEKGV